MPTTYAIPNGRTVFDATLYAGTGATNNVTNQLGFKPDLVWVKNRTSVNSHQLSDSVRGVNLALASDLTLAEYAGNINAFNTNGFQVTTSANAVNNSGQNYVGWQWQAGQGTTSSNTSGSITSTVSANTTAGFSIVTFITSSSTQTIGHGLGVTPAMIIVKNRSGVTNWPTYHQSLGATQAVNLNLTNSAATSSVYWNNTAPTSTVFTVSGSLFDPSQNAVAYCWAQVAGFSAFGSYTGNGSTDGPFIYTGFRPRWIMIKRTDAAYSWWINDSARDPRNVVGQDLAANLSDAESSDAPVQDFLSNGFKLRTSAYPGFNANGGSYIYAAFAENPFKYANAR